MISYDFKSDCIAIRTLLCLSQEQLATKIGVSFATINRIEGNSFSPSLTVLKALYSYAYKNKIELNRIKTQLFREEYTKILFHGAKKEIEGILELTKSKSSNDLGSGFYLGESYEQASQFICTTTNPSVYIFKYDFNNLKIKQFEPTIEWVLTIAYFRGYLNEYKNSKIIARFISELNKFDVVIAPIADNSIFELIRLFSIGLLTDYQIVHCLSATYLGKQYVFKSEKSLKQLDCVSRLFICDEELKAIADKRVADFKISLDKVELVKKQFANQGKRIWELL